MDLPRNLSLDSDRLHLDSDSLLLVSDSLALHSLRLDLDSLGLLLLDLDSNLDLQGLARLPSTELLLVLLPVKDSDKALKALSDRTSPQDPLVLVSNLDQLVLASLLLSTVLHLVLLASKDLAKAPKDLSAKLLNPLSAKLLKPLLAKTLLAPHPKVPSVKFLEASSLSAHKQPLTGALKS